MYFHDVLNFSQGVMYFENLESSRTPPPMMDKKDSGKYERRVKDQLMGIWDQMFPRTEEYYAEEEERRTAFKSKRGLYKKMREEINKKRLEE